MGEVEDERCSQASQLFENFVQSSTCKGTLQAFGLLCRQLELDPTDHRGFYSNLKAAVTSWKAKALWTKLDKRANHKEYKKGRACTDLRCLVIGGGPCGLRTAIELALLGAKVVVIEKRDTFSRNNVLHLWPYTIHDLRNLGAKKFYGKFCAGAIDHISIRQLQLILLKVSLIVGVEVHVNVEFVKLLEPPEKQDGVGQGWRAEMSPVSHPISDYEFDVLIGADGRRSTLHGFKRKEFRGKLAIAITANFVNRNTTAEAKVEEISGVAFIFNQKFFLELKEETGIDLENIVYYKDNTHYFVMTAKKQSLLDKGVIIHDYIETERLLHSDNVNQEALLSYAREAADFGTNYQLPSLDYAMNHYGQPDVAMFDFTCMYASENAALIREKNGHQLLVALVGDSLLEPFWPMGTGCARGFLAAFDTVWMVQGWAQGKAPLEALSERESIYRLLPQTTAENISKNFEQHTIDPATRYPNLNSTCVRPHQVQHLYINGEQNPCSLERSGPTRRSVNISRKESAVRPSRLLLWCQKQTEGYRGVNVTDLTTSWRSGLALCALIHHQRPDLIDFDSLNEADSAKNNQLAFEVAEKTFSIQPLITGQEMAAEQEPDKLVMVLYLSKFYEMFCNSSISSSGAPKETSKNNEDLSSKPKNSVYNSTNLALLRKRIPKDDKKVEDDKKRRKGISYLDELSKQSTSTAVEEGEQKENKVRSMATQLQAKFEENAPSCVLRRQVNLRKEFAPGMGGSDTCHFCKKRVYVMERLSAEGYFFHRECFRCDVCSATLRLGGHVFDQGTFYCKLHFSQRKTSHRLRKPQVHRSDVSVLDDTDGFSTSGSLHIKPSGVSSLPKTQEDLIIKVPQDIEKTAESSAEPQLSDPPKFTSNSMFGEPSVQDLATESEPLGPSSSQRVERSYARGDIIRNNHWKRKIRATLPLILLKSFEQKGAGDDALIEEDGDSDFEELHVPQEAENHASDSHCPLQEEPEKSAADEIPSYRTHGISSLPKSSPAQQPDASTPAPDQQSAFSSKKKLILSLSEKEKLLNWDLATPGTFSSTTEATDRAETYVRKPANSTEAQIHEEPRAPAEPEPSPTLSGFQLWASVLRRSFSGAGNNPKVIRRNRPRRVRPLSEGSFSFLFGVSAQNQEEDEDAVKRSRADTEGNQSRTEVRSEITAMLEQITLSNKPSRISKDDMASLPPRRLNFFSSMRMKRNDGGDRSKTGNQTKDVWSILSKFRNKASSQHNHHHDEDTYSSSEEDQKSVIQRSESGDSERRRKQQEKTLVMQTKREQLKQLHRAQVIQRQLEEVEEKQRALEEKGVALEKVLRGESEDAAVDESELLHTWFKLVLEKNKLARYESELMIFAQELELEDRQSQLQQDLRRRMATEDCKKSAAELAEEQVLLDEVMKVVEERDRLVSLLEEQRLQEKAEDHDLESLILSKGYQFHWA
ncbi:F-actin-monooxygenase mical2b isoform X4 [Tachysurus vachellii]|uniref:F-actin-monooxygenase mical2b isoform X4 n=1 Tax=Tachysurus vachellii TaxID=175792 RepID=UPI00296AC86E|nr:F-actin-monooxygenase mical2b isoform X4 [Tachysurus vachellii]